MIFNPVRYTNSTGVGKEIFAIPTQGGTVTYNGGSQSPSWNNYNTSYMTITGQTSGTNAGTYTVTFSLIDKNNTLWSDYTNSDKEVTWEIKRGIIITVPKQSGYLSYNGSTLYPTWSDYDPSKLQISGETSGINANYYTAIFTPTSNYEWYDKAANKTASWYIDKAEQTIYIVPSSLVLTDENPTGTIQVYGSMTGIAYASGVADEISIKEQGTTITITGIKNGEYISTIFSPHNENYLDSNIVYVPVTVSFNSAVGPVLPPSNLNDASWEQIEQLRYDGTLFNYYSIGDKKSVSLNGSIGNNFNLNNFNIDTFLVDDVGHAVFEFGKINDILTAFYNSTDFPMNNQNPITLMATNSGGWAASDMRLNILGADKSWAEKAPYTFMSLLPDDLGSVISMANNYTENSTTVQTSVTSTYDFLYLPSEFEIFGVCKYSYQEESSYQHQLKYYKLGNSKVFHEHSNLSNPVFDVWTRSRTAKTTANDTSSPTISQSFCCVHYDGTPSTQIANVSCGISVLFNI